MAAPYCLCCNAELRQGHRYSTTGNCGHQLIRSARRSRLAYRAGCLIYSRGQLSHRLWLVILLLLLFLFSTLNGRQRQHLRHQTSHCTLLPGQAALSTFSHQLQLSTWIHMETFWQL